MSVDVSTPPFSSIRRAAGLHFLSGEVGRKDGKLVEGGIEAELRQTFANIRETLGQQGMRSAQIVDVTAFLLDMNDYAIFNRVYVEEFEADCVRKLPTRTTVGVAELPLGARVELKVIVYGV